MQKIVPKLWFKDNAEEAAQFYTSISKNMKVISVAYYEESGAELANLSKGTVMSITLELEEQKIVLLNGGIHHKYAPTSSLQINCETQEEIDEFWEKLSDGGQKEMCGWIKDKYRVSWQIVPSILDKFIQQNNPEKYENMMKALLQMDKLDIEKLVQAYEQII